MKKFYISDTHFFHDYALRFDNRPYSNMDEMLDDMMKRWNSRVSNADHVYIAGDFVWHMGPEAEAYMRKLNGNLHLIIGNHDRFIKNKRFTKRFEEIVYYKEMRDTDGEAEHPIVICHYYIPYYNTHRYHGILIHGHSHNTDESKFERSITEENRLAGFKPEIYNVGCMLPYMDYAPRTLQEIKSRYKEFSESDM